MKATSLYEQLGRDFVTPSMTDSWAEYMNDISSYLTESFRQRSMGLVCDNAEIINKVYTAVFASRDVMQDLLGRGESDILLFVHHPALWDIRTAEVWRNMDSAQLDRFRRLHISIFNFHVPLDNYGPRSTSTCLARRVGINVTKPFFDYRGALVGVFGTTPLASVSELSRAFASALGHRTSLYRYGTDSIRNALIAIVAGGGNLVDVHKDISAAGCNTLLTGISVKDPAHEQAHEYAERSGINILGGTHYSTEKPACQAMCQYFETLGLSSEFIEETPVLEDL